MADLSDVETALAGSLSAALYPTGVPSNGLTVLGVKAKIRRGWPTPDEMRDDLAAGISWLTVYNKLGGNRDRSRALSRDWKDVVPAAPTLVFAQTAENVLIFGGTTTKTHNVCVLMRGLSYVQAVPVGASLASIAAAFASAIPGATAGGAALYLPTRATVTVGTVTTVGMELARRVQQFQIVIWGASPEGRDALGSIIEQTLALNYRLALADGFGAHVCVAGSAMDDAGQRANYYRREFIIDVEYPTTITQQAAQVVATDLSIIVNNTTANFHGNG